MTIVSHGEHAVSKVVIVQGAPGSGKSSVTESYKRHQPDEVQVLCVSAGKRIRDIRSGRIDSNFAQQIRDPNAPSPPIDEVFNGVVLEAFPDPNRDDLVLVDGFPRSASAANMFIAKLAASGNILIGSVLLDIPLEVCIDRTVSRGERLGERRNGRSVEEFAMYRYGQFKQNNEDVMRVLAQWPQEIIDASESLNNVQHKFFSSMARLTIRT